MPILINIIQKSFDMIDFQIYQGFKLIDKFYKKIDNTEILK